MIVLCQALAEGAARRRSTSSTRSWPKARSCPTSTSMPRWCRCRISAAPTSPPRRRAAICARRTKAGSSSAASTRPSCASASIGPPCPASRSTASARRRSRISWRWPAIPSCWSSACRVASHQKDIQQLGAGGLVHDVGRGIFDFAEAATALSQLDLLISIDAPIAHLAAAMGMKTWVLLPSTADWRWQLGGSRSVPGIPGPPVPPDRRRRLGLGVRRGPGRSRRAQAAGAVRMKFLAGSAPLQWRSCSEKMRHWSGALPAEQAQGLKRRRSSAVSTSSNVSASPTEIWSRGLARVSASASAEDQRTSSNIPRGIGRRRRDPISQKPPSLAGPKTRSYRPSCWKARAMWDGRIAGISLPTSTTGPEGNVRNGSNMRRPRSPWPCGRTRSGGTAPRHAAWRVSLSGVTNSQTVQRGSRFSRCDLPVEGRAVEAHRFGDANVAGEASLDPAELRRAGEDHEVTCHLPYSRAMAAGEHAGKIEGEAGEVAQRAHGPAIALVARRRGNRFGIERHQILSADAADQVDIFHQRQRFEAAEMFVERARHQQALVAIGQAERAGPPRRPAARRGGRAVGGAEAQAEVAGLVGVRGRDMKRPDGIGPARARAVCRHAGRAATARRRRRRRRRVGRRGRRRAVTTVAPALSGDRRRIVARAAVARP